MAMSPLGLLQTKMAIPSARADFVPRPCLTRRLDPGTAHPLTLICAPAGFGKTTLVTHWHEQVSTPDLTLAWFSLDEDDNDPNRFLMYLISALASVRDFNRDELLSALYSPQPPSPKIILTALINQIELSAAHVTLVLDDYHRVASQAVHEAITFLIEHLPAQMRLIITSREDPPLPLSRLRGPGQLTEIRADDLRFTDEEATEFMQQTLGVHLTIDQIENLDARTEGWIAGLQLVALAMKGQKDVARFITAFTGSHRYILDYLTEEVLNQQSSRLQNFLLETSILKRLNGALCNAVTGRNDGRAALEQIERSNLFLIALDDERDWYRYHHLFGDVLRQRLQQSHPELVSQLHQRASAWFEQNGWINEAVEHAFLSEDREVAARIVEFHSEHLWRRGEIATVLRWLKTFPETILGTHPKLELIYAFILALDDSYPEAEQHVVTAETALSQQPASAEQSTLLGEAAAIRATIQQLQEHSEAAIAAAQQALAQLSENDLYWRGWVSMIMGVAYYDAYGDIAEPERHLVDALRKSERVKDNLTLLFALLHLARLYLVRGQLGQAEGMAERLLRTAAKSSWHGQGYLERARVRYERNDLQGALADINSAQQVTPEFLPKRVLIKSRVLLARVRQLQGDEKAARDLMQQAVEVMQEAQLRDYFNNIFAAQAGLWLAQGDLAAAARWSAAIEPVMPADFNVLSEIKHIMVARVQIAQGRFDEAELLLSHLFQAAKDGGRFGRVIEIRVLQAVTARRQGRADEGLRFLESALSLGESEDYVRVFVDEGTVMEAMLRQSQAKGKMLPYIAKLLASFDYKSVSGTKSDLSRSWIGHQLEPLSERELEVLRLIAEGASNREIAEQLVVSLGTAKKHVSNIFTKLGAQNRIQVVAVAREQNLL